MQPVMWIAYSDLINVRANRVAAIETLAAIFV
jgi:hypothetical protein